MQETVKLISGSYTQVIKKLATTSPTLLVLLQQDASLYDSYSQILIDVGRTPFFGSEQDQLSFQDLWLNHHSQTYAQGQATGASVTNIIFSTTLFQHRLKQRDHTKNVTYDTKLMNVTDDTKLMRFAYISDKKQSSGCALEFYKSDPTLWMFAAINNANAKPDEIELNIYMSNELYQRLGSVPCSDVVFDEDLERHIDNEAILHWAQNSILNNRVSSAHNNIMAQPFGDNNYSRFNAAYSKLTDMEKKPPNTSKLQINTIKNQLEQIEQIYNTAIDQAKRNNQKSEAIILNWSAHELSKQCEKYLSLSPQEQENHQRDFKVICDGLIKESQKMLPYPSWDRLIINCALFVACLGVIYLAAGCTKYWATGNFLLYNPSNKIAEDIETAREQILALF